MASRKEYQMDFQLNAKLNGGFSGTMTKAQQQFAKIGTEIQKLSKTQGDISSYTKQQNAVEKTRAKLENLQKQHDLLQREIEQTGDETGALEREKLKLEQQIDRTNDALQNQETRLEATGQRLNEAGVDTENLTEESERLTNELHDLEEQQQRTANQSATLGEQMADAFDKLGQAIDVLGLQDKFAAIADAYKECVNTAAALEATMSNVGAISGASGDEMVELTDKAREMGATTKFTAVEAGEALSFMSMAGWKSSQMIDGLEGIMNLAAASGEDLASTSDIVTDALTAFGLQASDSGHFADILAIASSNANTNVAMMGETFKYAAPMMGAMGYSAEDAAIAIGMMANSGIKASSAGTALRAGLVNLAKPTEQMQAAMDKYGISLTDASGEMLPFRDLMQELRDKLGGLSEVEQTAAAGAIFGKNALSGWLAIVNGSQADFDKLTASVDNCAGATEKMAQIQLDNLTGDLTLMDSAMDGLKTTIGNQLIPVLRPLVQWFTEVIGQMDDWIQNNESLFKGITVTIGVLGGLTSAIVAVSGAIKAFQALKAIGLFSSLAGPIGVATLAVAGLAGAVAGAVAEYNRGVTPVKDLTTAIQDMDSTLTDGKQAYQDTRNEYQATAKMADIYIDRLEALGEANAEDVDHSTEYMATLQLLCDTVPELSDLINLQTGEIQGGTEALRANTDAWKENMQQQAEQDYLKEVMSGYSDVQKEVFQNEVKLMQKQAEHKDIEDRLASAQRAQAQAQEDANRGIQGSGPALAKANREVANLTDELKRNERNQENLQTAIDEGNATLGEQERSVEEARQAIEDYEKATGDAADANEDMSATADDIVGAVDGIVASATELSEEYQKAYDSAKESLEGQFGFWDEAELAVAGSTSEIIANLQSQSAYLDQYNTNLAQLRDRAHDIEGLDEALDSLNNGSEESAKTYETLTKANDDDLRAFVAAWQERENQQELTANNIATTQTGMLNDLDGFSTDVQEKIKGMDFSDDAAKAAKDTIQSYIDELNGQIGPVSEAARAIYKAAYNELNRSLPTPGTTQPSTWNRSHENATGSYSAISGETIVGENGPEMVMLKGGERIVPSPQTAEMLRSSPVYGGTTLNFAPQYTITGGDVSNTKAALSEHDKALKNDIMRMLSNAQRDRERTVYR